MKLNTLVDRRVANICVVAFASVALFGASFRTAMAQGLHPLQVSYLFEDNSGGLVGGPFAVASHNVSGAEFPQVGGHGSTMGLAYGAYNVDVTQGQWRLITTGPVSSLINVNANCVGGPPLCPMPIEPARQAVQFSGFDSVQLGYSLQVGWSVHPGYSTFRSSASPIASRVIPNGGIGSLDVTDFMRSLPTYSDPFNSSFVVPGFLMELQPVHTNGNWVLFFSLALENRDGSFNSPWLPRDCVGLTCHFDSVPTGVWVDPVVAAGFEYRMTGGSLFTSIVDFPPGFDGPFTVSVDGISLGQFTPGESVDFTSFSGGGVSSFIVSGISPAVDPTNQLAFPLQLQFNTPTASFDMIALVPEPSFSLILLSTSAATLICRRRGKRRT